MDKPVLLNKKSKGAILFQTFFNNYRKAIENIEANYIKVLRILGEMKRRTDVLEETVGLQSKILFAQEPEITMSCIACGRTFGLPQPIAQAQNGVSCCPACYSAALPLKQEHEYSLREIAQMTGFAYGTVCQTVRKMHLKPLGERRLFGEPDFKKIEAALSGKKPRRKKLERGTKNGSDT